MARYVHTTLFVASVLALASCSSPAQDEIQTAKARKELFGQLDRFYDTKDAAAVAKAAPELLKDIQRFVAKTPKDEEQWQVINVAVRVLETKGQYEVATKLLADVKSQYADVDKALAKDAGKSHDLLQKRASLLGKPLKLEGKLVDGGTFDLGKYKGKVVLVDFWATWCGPCVKELPNVKENYTKYHDKGFEVIGVSLDDEVDTLKDFIKNRKVPWQTLNPGDAIADKFGVQGIPFTVLVDREGKIVALNVLGEAIGEQVEKLLAEKAEKK
jgi:thiol-disulfide isomerase/thioredoxin